MNYRNILPLVSHTQEFSTDYWNDFGYWNDGTFWYEKTPTYTARVTAYAAATGITDYTILDPLNIFDLGLTYYGLDTIMKAIYPMVTDKTNQSDMANQMKYNFMNPLDTNAAFRLQWFGGWVYSRTGALSNEADAYADTWLAPTAMGINSIHGSSYLRINTPSNGPAFSTEDAGTFNNAFYLFPKITASNNYSVRINDSTSAFLTQNYDIRGLNLINRISVNSKKYRINNTEVFSLTTATTARNSQSIYIARLRTTNTFFKNEYSFISFGDGLTDFQAQIFSSLVNNLQKALNRAVY